MTLPAPTYDLVLLLDAQAEESTRAKILADARASIEARGELVRDDDWGERPLTYPIGRRKSAAYHLFQFHVSDKDLLGGLDRTLRITDGVVRFRLIKLRPGVPDPPDMRSSAIPRARPEGEPAPAAPTGEYAPPADAGEQAQAPTAPAEAAQAEAPAAAAPPTETPAPEATAPAAAEQPPAAAEQPPEVAEQPPAEGEQPEPAAGDTPPPE